MCARRVRGAVLTVLEGHQLDELEGEFAEALAHSGRVELHVKDAEEGWALGEAKLEVEVAEPAWL